jgi:hypothetical protein
MIYAFARRLKKRFFNYEDAKELIGYVVEDVFDGCKA